MVRLQGLSKLQSEDLQLKELFLEHELRDSSLTQFTKSIAQIHATYLKEKKKKRVTPPPTGDAVDHSNELSRCGGDQHLDG
jgi:hypothetical protein